VAALYGLARIPPPATVERAENRARYGRQPEQPQLLDGSSAREQRRSRAARRITEVLVIGMLIGCISVCTSSAGRAREVLGHCAGLFGRVVVRLRHVRALRLVIEGA